MRHEPDVQESPATSDAHAPVDEEAIRELVTRLSRPHRTGGLVVERASLLAEGSDFGAVMAWIEAHGGEPEMAAAPRTSGGLHSSRLTAPPDATPLRFILPSAALR